jgi:simple sugar transport system ATP-binding protein
MCKSYRTAPIGGKFLLARRAARQRAAELVHRFDIRGATLDAPAGALSGGNLQKLLLARELSADPELLVASQPTRGLDVGASESIRQLLLEQRAVGRALLLISEDLDELAAISDRIAVIHAGRINGTFPGSGLDRREIGLRMAGHAA